MAEHMPSVMEIVRKLGLQPMMWADMFFRTVLPNSLYRTMDEIRFPQDIIDSVPPEMGLIYWDYRGDSELIAKMIKDHKRLSDQVIFAGCVRNNRSFCYNHHVSTKHNHTAYMTCKQEGVEEMITTIWGDNAPENTVFNTLLGLQYCAERKWKKRIGLIASISAAMRKRRNSSASPSWISSRAPIPTPAPRITPIPAIIFCGRIP